jgi:hypothetical protein
LEYAADELRRLAEESSVSPDGWGAQTLRDYRKTLQLVRAAKSVEDLRSLRSCRMSEDGAVAAILIGEAHAMRIRFEEMGADASALVLAAGRSETEEGQHAARS